MASRSKQHNKPNFKEGKGMWKTGKNSSIEEIRGLRALHTFVTMNIRD